MLGSACCALALGTGLRMSMAGPVLAAHALGRCALLQVCMHAALQSSALIRALLQGKTSGASAATTSGQASSPEGDPPAPAVNVPMFPRELSEGLFSLQQGRQCCTLSVSVVLGADGAVQEQSLTAATIVPSRRVPYDQADELLQTTQQHEEPELHALRQASRAPQLGPCLLPVQPGLHAPAGAGCHQGATPACGCETPRAAEHDPSRMLCRWQAAPWTVRHAAGCLASLHLLPAQGDLLQAFWAQGSAENVVEDEGLELNGLQAMTLLGLQFSSRGSPDVSPMQTAEMNACHSGLGLASSM